MKHEYTDSELAELKNIYDEQGEAGLSITEMRALRKEGLLPAFDKHSPRKTRETTTTGKKEEIMTAVTVQEQKPQSETENPRAVIVNALVNIYDSISALQRAAYHANDKVVYGFATKLLNGELMDIKANYSKDAK